MPEDLWQIQELLGRRSQYEVEESVAIYLLKSITKIKEMIFEIIFALFSTVDMLQNCWVFFPTDSTSSPWSPAAIFIKHSAPFRRWYGAYYELTTPRKFYFFWDLNKSLE